MEPSMVLGAENTVKLRIISPDGSNMRNEPNSKAYTARQTPRYCQRAPRRPLTRVMR